ncbi:hypothetical protein ACWCPJ_31710 [Streptomyces collinus]|uniref:hypothetical protein n=1 Tax=Streptomyces collinus TaxID=42684 RepID=UPI003698FA0A
MADIDIRTAPTATVPRGTNPMRCDAAPPLEFRVTRAYEESVAPGTIVFRSRGNTDRLHEVVKFTWEMAPRDGGEIAGVGLEILMLGPDGHIVSDNQFIEG